MRESLKRSLADTPAQGFERYPKGSVVICNACSLPIFRLDIAVDLGAKAGQAAKAFKPLTMADLDILANRDDIDAGLQAMVTSMSHEQRARHVAKLREMHAGDPMLCPACNDCFVQVVAVTKHEVLDKAYTIELLTVPPNGAGSPIRGRRIGYGKDWVH